MSGRSRRSPTCTPWSTNERPRRSPDVRSAAAAHADLADLVPLGAAARDHGRRRPVLLVVADVAGPGGDRPPLAGLLGLPDYRLRFLDRHQSRRNADLGD